MRRNERPRWVGTGKPDAGKPARPVWGRAFGKGVSNRTTSLGAYSTTRRETDEEAAAWPQDRTGRQLMDRVAGRRLFTDSIERVVYEDDEGRQYVLGPGGERVDGRWLAP